jgi:hypothetical protein
VDAERAERHLRLLAEAELRRLLGQPRQDAIGQRSAMMESLERLGRVERALAAVGAIGVDLVDAVGAEFRTALRIRGLDPAGFGLHLSRARRFRSHGGAAVAYATSVTAARGAGGAVAGGASPAYPGTGPGPSAVGPGPGTGWTAMTVIPVGRMVPFQGEYGQGEVYFLSLVITPKAASLPAIVRVRSSPSGPVTAIRAGFTSLQVMSAADDRGRPYHLVFTGRSGGPSELWEGHFEIHPVPPPAARWLEVVSDAGEPTVRIDLGARPGLADATVQPAPSTPGERLLEAIAQGLLVSASGRFPQPADGLGDIVAALEAAGALSAFSPAPARLAALCQRLDIRDHGIMVPPARDLPKPWTDILAHYGRRHRPPGRDGIAALPVRLPEIDGAGFALAGLQSREDLTVLYVFSHGLPGNRGHYRAGLIYFGFCWWLRDDAGHWHAAVTNEWQDDGSVLRLCVYPPLGRAVSSVDLTVSGTASQLRAHVPVSWWAAP